MSTKSLSIYLGVNAILMSFNVLVGLEIIPLDLDWIESITKIIALVQLIAIVAAIYAITSLNGIELVSLDTAKYYDNKHKQHIDRLARDIEVLKSQVRQLNEVASVDSKSQNK